MTASRLKNVMGGMKNFFNQAAGSGGSIFFLLLLVVLGSLAVYPEESGAAAKSDKSQITPIYVTVAGHIEGGSYYANCSIYPEYRDKLLIFADLMRDYNIPCNLQIDYEFFMGAKNCETPEMQAETEGTNVVDYLARYRNFEIDAHQDGGFEEEGGPENYADVRRIGGLVTPGITETVGGMIWNWQEQYERFKNGEAGQRYPDFTWLPDILTLGVGYLHHEGDFSRDDLTSGIWKPGSFDTDFLIHDESARMIYIGPGMSCTNFFGSQDSDYPPMESTADYVELMVDLLANEEIPTGKIYTVTIAVPQKIIFEESYFNKLTDQFDQLSDLVTQGKVIYVTYKELVEIWRDEYNSVPNIFTYDNIDSENYIGPLVPTKINIFRPDSGLWAIKNTTRAYFGGEDDIPIYRDFDGDSLKDLALFRPSTGLWAIRNISRLYFGSTSDQPQPSDYNGDGTVDIGIFREGSGLWAIRGISRTYFGATNDAPVPADYDGDGSSDIAVFREASGLWAVKGISRAYFGSTSDSPQPGIYTGDGTAEIGIYRPTSGLWAIRGVTRIYFGGADDDPVPQDYDWSGTEDIGVFRESSGMWAIRGISRTYFGSFGDIPVTK